MKAQALFHNEEFQIIESDQGRHLFVVNGSKLYDLPPDLHIDRDNYEEIFDSLKENLTSERYIGTTPLSPPKLAALSLNVAQGCNLSCSYCYADEGKFSKHSRLMQSEISFQSIDRLFAEAEEGATVTVGFMGGEPLLNRELLHESTKYASRKAQETGRKVKFSVTTNGTLLKEEDVRLFMDYPYNVTISLDGPAHFHNLLRKTHSGKGSYDAILKKMELFDRIGRPEHLSARSTITPKNTGLPEALDHLISLGFDDVGFSPVLVSPNPQLAFEQEDFDRFLQEMIQCGETAVEKLVKGERYPFSNLETALFEIHRGSHRPYPCGAAAGYMSVNAEGEFYACHRLIDDQDFFMGNLTDGLEHEARKQLLEEKFVDKIEPCKSCWARYLCGGGCYHEVKARERIACNYIKGWLTFCLSAYSKILSENPSYFDSKKKKHHG
jgi:uncharacterized protein